MGSCLGCEMQAQSREWSFELKKQEAQREANKNQVDMAIYMEGAEWKILRADLCAGRPIREIVRFIHAHAG